MSGESVESVQALSERIEPAEAHLPAQEEAFPSVGNVGVPRLVSRRRVVTAALAASGAVIAGTLVVGGINLAHMMPSASNAQSTQGGKGARPHPTGKGKSASAPSKQPPGSQKQTGTVIGSSNLALNSSVDFTNPVDGKASLLIHLPDHRFVAYESACTHQGVTVHYDTATHTLVCPAHGSVFDPTNGGKVLQGPAMRPLPPVAIHVNANGTITVG
jgi:Rieske Fe-S protein